jgi:AbrB family looped-hinge helix DNA binding protein
MMTVTVKMSRKNQIVLPKAVRTALGLRGGDQLSVQIKKDAAILKAQPLNYTERLAGMGAHLFPRGMELTAWLLKERDEWDNSEKRRRALLGFAKTSPKPKRLR